jgi:hypothetical protein
VNRAPSAKTEDLPKLVTKIYLSLEKLGFSISVIQQALRETRAISFEGVLEWICMNVAVEELPSGFYDKHDYEQGNSRCICVTKKLED